MRSKESFSILFWIYSKRVDRNNQCKLYARITANGSKSNIGLLKKVDVSRWDSKLQKLKGNLQESRETNFYINEIRSEIFHCYRELKQEGRIITSELVKARYTGEDKLSYTLKDLFKYHNDKFAEKLAPKTLCHYRTSQKYILEFINSEYNKSDYHLRELKYPFLISFENFLRSYRPRHYQKQIGNNAVMKHIQRLRKLVTLAFHMEWIERDPFVKFKPKLIKTNREFLTKGELNRIENHNFSLERLEVVRDLFIFSCYTGISYADTIVLKADRIVKGADGYNWIISNREKNQNPYRIPILPKTEMLIDKYHNHIRTRYNGLLLPKLSNQRLNGYLKEISDICGINKNLTFHMARHTFATTVTLTNGVPIETVSKLMGHRKLATTQIYAKVIEEKVMMDIGNLRDKLQQ